MKIQKNNFVGVFPSDKIKREKSNAKHPFLISNTRAGTEGTHWSGILDFHRKAEIFFFDSFSVKGLKDFIIRDDKEIN